MVDLSFYVGILGNVVSILVFCSPVTTFRRVLKNKSTENFTGIPYVTTLLSTSLWTYYGLLKHNGLLVVTVNGAGAVLQAIYVGLYIIYSPRETKAKMLKLVLTLNVFLYGAVVAITFFSLQGEVRLRVIGVLCAGLTVGMYASPMSAMRTVVKTESVEYMPFFLSFFLFLNAGIWSVYAYLVRDYFIGVPNAIGFVLGSIQLILYAIYYKKTVQAAKARELDEEEGGATVLFRRIELQTYGDDIRDGRVERRSLAKGGSLPKPTTISVARQQSLDKIAKSPSIPQDLQSHLQPVQA